MSTPINSDPLRTPEEILLANAAGTLLRALANAPYRELDTLAKSLAALHESGSLDVLTLFGSSQLDTVSDNSFFKVQQIFCRTLPQIDGLVGATATTCKILFEKGGNDLCAGRVYDALSEWFRNKPERVDEGLALIRQDLDTKTGSALVVLTAGAIHDLKRFSSEALDLSYQPQSHIRLDALRALGRMELEDNDDILARVIDRLDEVITSPLSEQDTATAIDTALRLLDRISAKCMGLVEPLVLKVCKNPSPIVRHAIAVGLQTPQKLTERMIDAMFTAIEVADKHVPRTIAAIDLALSQWDLEKDRERILRILKALLSHSEDAIDFETLDSFQGELARKPGDLLGWYAVSLLLTGDHRLCLAADQLLPHDKAPDGLDIDLTPFALNDPWLLFLARKILGYLTFKKDSATALLLSCLRAVSNEARKDLDAILRDFWLINFPGAIKLLEANVLPDDPAHESVKSLSTQLESYFEELDQCGICDAFRPSDRARQLQSYQQADFWRNVQKEAEKRSVLSSLIHRSTLLYGTGLISYIYEDEDSDPRRQELPMTSYEHTIEIPRLELLEPVRLRYDIYRFQSEPPPS